MHTTCASGKNLTNEIFRYTNRVDDLYASWPAIMTINSTWGRYILEPLLQYQSGTESQYAIADLGDFSTFYLVSHWTDGFFQDILFPMLLVATFQVLKLSVSKVWILRVPYLYILGLIRLPESSNMLLMIWAQARFSGEKTLAQKYVCCIIILITNLFLTNINSTRCLNAGQTIYQKLFPEAKIQCKLEVSWSISKDDIDVTAAASIASISADGDVSSTNLALKGILAIRAMAELAAINDKKEDLASYIVCHVRSINTQKHYALILLIWSVGGSK